MEDLVGQATTQSLHARPILWRKGCKPRTMALKLELSQHLDTRPHRLDRRHKVEAAQPVAEGVYLALVAGVSRDLTQVVEVVHENPIQGVDTWIKVARHSEIDHEHRTVIPLPHHRAEVVRPKERLAHSG